jgi:peptide deformylase
MSVQDPIVQVGDPVLHKKAKTIDPKDINGKKLQALIAKMKRVLRDEDYGVALAAPQVGESLRLFVIAGKALKGDDEDASTPEDKVFINPELMRLSRKKAEMSEGCLSVRGKYGSVVRHEKASARALDEHGKPFVHHGTGLVAHIFQHECDHLDGILYIDKAVHLEEDDDLKGARTKLKEKHGV